MLTLHIQNVGEDATGHTYRVEVLVNGRRIDMLIVKGHDRADGWAWLLVQIAIAKFVRDAVEAQMKMVEWIREDGK